jgi:hypothetical protein
MNPKLELDCPTCGGPVDASIRELAAQDVVTCRAGHEVSLADSGRFARGLVAAMDSPGRLRRRVRRGRRVQPGPAVDDGPIPS